MIEKLNSNPSIALLARPAERTGAGDQKPEPAVQRSEVVAMPTYDFQFRVDTHTHEVTAFIIDPETRTVIREIPAKEMQAAADVIRRLIGPMVDKTV